MFCSNCGKSIADGNKACPYCGKVLEIEKIQSAQYNSSPVQQIVYTQNPVVNSNKNNSKRILIIIVIVLALIAVAVAVFAIGMKIGEANTDTEVNTITQHNHDEDRSEKEPDGDSDDSGITITINGGTGVAAGGSSATPKQQSMVGAEEKELVQSASGLEMPQDGDAINITKAYNKAINGLKAYTGKVTLTKTEVIDIEAKEVPEAIESAVNGVIENFIGTTTDTSIYNNGADAYGKYLNEVIIPGGRDACVTEKDITACSIKENADGGYTITMTFLAESVTFDGTASTEPVHHETAMNSLDLATLDVAPFKIASAEVNYPGATVTLTVDGEGRLVKLHSILPVNGKYQGGLGSIKATVGLEDSSDSIYTVIYG